MIRKTKTCARPSEFLIEYREDQYGVFKTLDKFHDENIMTFEVAQRAREDLLHRGFFEPIIKRAIKR